MPRKAGSGKYPEQIVAPMSAEMKQELVELAGQRGKTLSATTREVIAAGLGHASSPAPQEQEPGTAHAVLPGVGESPKGLSLPPKAQANIDALAASTGLSVDDLTAYAVEHGLPYVNRLARKDRLRPRH